MSSTDLPGTPPTPGASPTGHSGTLPTVTSQTLFTTIFGMMSTLMSNEPPPPVYTVTVTTDAPATTAAATTEMPPIASTGQLTSRAATVGTPSPPPASDGFTVTPPDAAARADGAGAGGGGGGISAILDYWYYAAIVLGLFIAALVFVIYRSSKKPVTGDGDAAADAEKSPADTPTDGSVYSVDPVYSDGATSLDLNTSENDDDDDFVGGGTQTEASDVGETDVYDP